MASISSASYEQGWGNICLSFKQSASLIFSGNFTRRLMYRFPFWNGAPCTGIPSSLMQIQESGFVTLSPGLDEITSFLLSSCSTSKTYPQRASVRVMVLDMSRSAPLRLNKSCSFCSRTKMRSPGATPGWVYPASPFITIFWPCFIPGSMTTSKIFFSVTNFLPLHFPHLSSGGMYSPVPPQAEHLLWTCWIMPGPSCLI
mmetsp:Transcript_9419/g.32594  ORF Transcript_9419/g.32594 Transcript_9419/m.32594 type:complete len:200 (-) Transcript_9419:674-1273(-)